MAENQHFLDAVAALRRDLREVASSVDEVKTMLSEMREILTADHEKIESLEAHAEQDHEKLQKLEKTREDLERTGRIQVRPTIGL